ncbi:MAG: toprim domain-containing protein [Thermoplasmata archaeon]|nr:toprim domain-containing protein [Thermoplasmata archaeon]
MDYEASLKKIESAIEELKELNKTIPIIVEGPKDVEALHSLGINGKIITIYKGMEIANFCDFIAANYKEIIILTDWDKQGWRLCKKLVKNLKGRTKCNTDFHKLFAENTIVKDIEGMPSSIERMKEKLGNPKFPL